MSRARRVIIALGSGEAYLLAMRRGILAYRAEAAQWMLSRAPIAPDRFAQIVRQWRPDGAIVFVFGEDLAERIAELALPCVNVSGRVEDPRLPRLHSDDAAAGRVGAAHLLERGLAHFAFIGQPELRLSRMRCAGFTSKLAEAGHTPVVFDDAVGDEDAVRTWLRRLPKPVGVMAVNDAMGETVLDHCFDMGLAVPDEVSVLGIDDVEMVCEVTLPPLSSVRMPFERVGYEAARLLDRLMAGHTRPVEPVLLPPQTVVARQSTNALRLDDPHVAQAVQLIEDGFRELQTVADILERVPVSRRHLEQQFTRLFGRTPLQQLHRAKMKHGTQMLLDTDLPIYRIAAACGYRSAKHFTEVFRREMTCTPTDFRQRSRIG